LVLQFTLDVATISEQRVLRVVKFTNLHVLQDHSNWEAEEEDEVFADSEPDPPWDVILLWNVGNLIRHDSPWKASSEHAILDGDPIDFTLLGASVQ